jgi:hypothetical protein
MKTNLSDSISRGLGEQHAEKLDQSSTKNVLVLGGLILKNKQLQKDVLSVFHCVSIMFNKIVTPICIRDGFAFYI